MAYSITDACGGCTLCAKFCPVAAISGKPKELHAINAKRCVECGVCGRACTKNAVIDGLGNPLPRAPRKDWPKPAFDSARCSACGICVQVCTAGALAISLPKRKGDLRVSAYLANEKKCVGCGLCAQDCPMDAVQMQDVSSGAAGKKQEEVAA